MLALKNMIRACWCCLLLASGAALAETPAVRVAVLQFGTLNWEMDVIQNHGLDKKYQFDLAVTPLGGADASTVALQSGAVDLIYSDWVWVNRQRHSQRMYAFSPVSVAAGGIYVQPDLGAKTLADLQGKRLGVAGGPVDKSWLMVQAYSKKALGLELPKALEPVYAAPPLLNKMMTDRQLPAVLNFWHFGARLKAQGVPQLISVHEVLAGLGITTDVPLLGWVVAESWVADNADLLNRFLLASAEAREILLNSDAEWERIKPLTKSESDAIFIALRDEYRAGVLREFSPATLKALQDLYGIFAREGGQELTGGADTLDTSLFLMPSANGLVRSAP
mgnify:CR=1 FL=1